MAKIELRMPKMGESIIEATILKWTKSIGDPIEQEETVVEIATDKVDSEVPAPADGKLSEIKYQEGDVVPVGEVIAIIETVGQADKNGENGHVPEHEKELTATVPFVPSGGAHHSRKQPQGSDSVESKFFSPLVLNIARKEGIPMSELESLPGTGRGGRVTKKDILAYVKHKKSGMSSDQGSQNAVTPTPQTESLIHTAPQTTAKTQDASSSPLIREKQFKHIGSYEIEEMDRMRKMISDNMLYSSHVAAHVTSFVEADVTAIYRWRQKVKSSFLDKYKEKLTFTPLFIQAIAKALREYPRVNSSVDGNNILLKKDINIGVAVALPNDNLIVPVIRNADRMNLVGLTTTVNDLANRARTQKLTPEELEGGTYTMSNVGTFGNVMGTPIIMQPQVGIMAFGAIRKLPAVLETPQGDVIAIRNKMFLSHSYDHRIIDGALGGKFVRRVADILEAWDEDMDI